MHLVSRILTHSNFEIITNKIIINTEGQTPTLSYWLGKSENKS